MLTHDVFISYSTKNKNVADAIVADFEQHNIKCWYAPRDILPGDEWAKAIKEGLDACEIFILVFTEASNSSRQVMNEVAMAFNAGKTIIPFKLTEEALNYELEYYLTRVHWQEALTEPISMHITTLRKTVGRILQKEPTLHAAGHGKARGTSGKNAETIQKNAAKKRHTPKWIIPVCAAVFLLLAGAYLFSVGLKEKSGEQKDSQDWGTVVASGTLNEKVSWIRTDQKVLLIEGEGPMPDLTWGTEGPNQRPTEWSANVIEMVIVGDGLTSVGANSFNGLYSLERVLLGKDVKRIGDNAFAYDEKISELVLPEGLSEIGPYAFQDLQMMEAFDLNNEYFKSADGVLFSADMEKLIVYPAGKKDRTYTVPDGVKTIMPLAFGYNQYLQELTFPQGLERIGQYAFAKSAGLKRLEFPSSLAVISGAAVFEQLGTREEPLELVFNGLPAIENENAFSTSVIHAFVPAGIWPEEKMQAYGGEVLWTEQ